ncbi:hypothetical protein CMI38_01360 [Candidatus Pacearchaeota archaeon]|jgi:hypothetical protein|nr:hypothetical protein [Candidatus Pacearchaeota archaeon]|tara:strand:- start:2484 stop:3071 length:588 start_codon:yes stop_codon:yes gene_type:complete
MTNVSDNKGLTYEFVKAHLPGTLDDHSGTYCSGRRFRIGRDNWHIEATFPQDLAPKGIHADNLNSFSQPVLEEIATIDSLRPEMIKLRKEDNFPESLYYTRPAENHFRVYDNSSTPPRRVFDRLLLLRNTDPEFLDIPSLSYLMETCSPSLPDIIKEPGKLAYVEGNSLDKAVRKALSIFSHADKLRKIQVSLSK